MVDYQSLLDHSWVLPRLWESYRSLGWTQARNVYVIYVGQDVQALSHQFAAANAHVAQLEAQMQQLQAQQSQQTPPDPKALEAFAALVELAKALRLERLVAA